MPSRRGRQSSSAEPKKKQTPQEVSKGKNRGCDVASSAFLPVKHFYRLLLYVPPTFCGLMLRFCGSPVSGGSVKECGCGCVLLLCCLCLRSVDWICCYPPRAISLKPHPNSFNSIPPESRIREPRCGRRGRRQWRELLPATARRPARASRELEAVELWQWQQRRLVPAPGRNQRTRTTRPRRR